MIKSIEIIIQEPICYCQNKKYGWNFNDDGIQIYCIFCKEGYFVPKDQCFATILLDPDFDFYTNKIVSLQEFRKNKKERKKE